LAELLAERLERGAIGRLPAQRVEVFVERHVEAERGEPLVERGLRAMRLELLGERLLASDLAGPRRRVRGDRLDRAVGAEDGRGALLAPARDAGDAVGGVADQGEEVGDRGGRDAEPARDALLVGALALAAVPEHDAPAAHALAEVFVGAADAHLVDARIGL